MARDARNTRIADEVDWIGAARVLRDARVPVINRMVLIQHDIFQHGPKAKSLKDVRFAFRREIDRLGVAAPLNVEDAVV